MQKKVKQALLAILLVIVLTTMILQFKYFGTGRYWITVLVLLVAWLVSKWLQREGERSGGS